MVILGIDPGLASTGYGAIFCNGLSPSLRSCGYIKTSPSQHLPDRLSQIYSDIGHLITTLKPDLVAIENAFSLPKYPKAGILLGSVLGILYLAVFQHGLRMVEVTPREVKSSLVGYGGATKNQIKESTKKILGARTVTSFHAADALAVALTAFYRKGT